jgi:cellulose synthase/poly-beta-1,6-N-acetylglucosamine synthase-like glycosyltransferase
MGVLCQFFSTLAFGCAQCNSYNLDFIYIYIYVLLFRILAPTTYIFFASAIPVISFGEQLERDTGWLAFIRCHCPLL